MNLTITHAQTGLATGGNTIPRDGAILTTPEASFQEHMK